MTKFQTWALVILRVSMGWLCFYSGITKVLDPTWTAEGYLQSATTLSGFYSWFAQPEILPFVDLLNAWGLTLIGVSLILGVFVRLSASLGAFLMLLYYFPTFSFPVFGESSSYLIDSHIIYTLALVVLVAFNAGAYISIGPRVKKMLRM